MKKKGYLLLLISLYLSFLFLGSCNTLSKKKKIVFLGDSITYMGGKQAKGIRPTGFINIIDSFIKIEGLEDRYQTYCSGVQGNKVIDLYLRYPEDVLDKSPDIVVLYVGLNDIQYKKFGKGTDNETFGNVYSKLVKRLENNNCKVIICTLSVIGENIDTATQINKDLDSYSKWFFSVAKPYGRPVVDLRKAFLEYEAKYNKLNKDSGLLTYDGIHLTAQGNKLVAYKIWETLKNE